jgi:hypothetical protein
VKKSRAIVFAPKQARTPVTKVIRRMGSCSEAGERRAEASEFGAGPLLGALADIRE